MNADDQRSIDRMVNNNEMAPEKLEPTEDIRMEYIFSKVMEYVHEQGQTSLERIMESGQDFEYWPIRLQLDVLLKLMLNEIGSLQAQVLELQSKETKDDE